MVKPAWCGMDFGCKTRFEVFCCMWNRLATLWLESKWIFDNGWMEICEQGRVAVLRVLSGFSCAQACLKWWIYVGMSERCLRGCGNGIMWLIPVGIPNVRLLIVWDHVQLFFVVIVVLHHCVYVALRAENGAVFEADRFTNSISPDSDLESCCCWHTFGVCAFRWKVSKECLKTSLKFDMFTLSWFNDYTVYALLDFVSWICTESWYLIMLLKWMERASSNRNPVHTRWSNPSGLKDGYLLSSSALLHSQVSTAQYVKMCELVLAGASQLYLQKDIDQPLTFTGVWRG